MSGERDSLPTPGANVPAERTAGRSSRRRLLIVGAVVVVALTGFGGVGWYVWQRYFVFHDRPVAYAAPPNSKLVDDPVVAAVAPSVVKVRSLAPSCQKVFEGSGFVVAPERVMTNAHVVAGSSSVSISAGGNSLDAVVVSYDPQADIAIVAVPNLKAAPLVFDSGFAPAKPGTDALVLGYPGAAQFAAAPARIRESFKLSGPDIYRSAHTVVTREVYTIRAVLDQGYSGGPLIDLDGRVLGVAFGSAKDAADTGFALTADEVGRQLTGIINTQPASTGACAASDSPS